MNILTIVNIFCWQDIGVIQGHQFMLMPGVGRDRQDFSLKCFVKLRVNHHRFSKKPSCSLKGWKQFRSGCILEVEKDFFKRFFAQATLTAMFWLNFCLRFLIINHLNQFKY